MRRSQFCGFAAACLLFINPVLATAASLRDCDVLLNTPVMVTLTDGRTPRGVLSPKSSDDSLVLRTEVPGIAIESRFAWGLVQSVDPLSFTDAKPLPRPTDPVPDDEALSSEPTDNKAPAERVFDNAVPPAPMLPEARRLHETIAPSSAGLLPFNGSEIAPMDVLPPLVPLDHRRAVRALHVRATVANWDRDAEVDGLLLHVQPLDGFGVVVPVDGNIDVQLATETKFAKGGRSITRDDNTFNVTERWSVPIHAIDFDAMGTTVKLPFRRFHPERQFDIASDALAVARLRLPSAGAFDASDPFVQLRPYSRFRDDLQEYQGRRLFPGEGAAPQRQFYP